MCKLFWNPKFLFRNVPHKVYSSHHSRKIVSVVLIPIYIEIIVGLYASDACLQCLIHQLCAKHTMSFVVHGMSLRALLNLIPCCCSRKKFNLNLCRIERWLLPWWHLTSFNCSCSCSTRCSIPVCWHNAQCRRWVGRKWTSWYSRWLQHGTQAFQGRAVSAFGTLRKCSESRSASKQFLCDVFTRQRNRDWKIECKFTQPALTPPFSPFSLEQPPPTLPPVRRPETGKNQD